MNRVAVDSISSRSLGQVLPDLIPPRSPSAGHPGAHGTAALLPAGAGIDHRFPAVAQAALPPDLFPAAHGHILGRQAAVEGGVPLGGDGRGPGAQVVEARQDLPPGAVGAAAAVSGPGGHQGLIGVARRALPPDLAVGVGGDLLGRQALVSLRVPLGGDLREPAGQVVLPGQDLPAGAHGAAAAVGPAVDLGLPAVAFLTDPPHLFPAAGGEVPGRPQAVAWGVPLGQEVLPSPTAAEVPQRLSHGRPSLSSQKQHFVQ